MTKVIVWNTGGAPKKNTIRPLRLLCMDEKVSVIALTETRMWDPSKPFLNGWKTTSNKGKFTGTTLLTRNDVTVKKVITDEAGRYISCKIESESLSASMIVIYAPAKDIKTKSEWWNNNICFIEKHDLVLGDFNYAYFDKQQTNNKNRSPDLSIEVKKKVDKAFDKFKDAALRRNADKVWMTYFHKGIPNSRIDRVLHNGKANCTKYSVLSDINLRKSTYMDHCPIVCTIINRIPPKTQWKFKSYLFNNETNRLILEREVGNLKSPGNWNRAKSILISRVKQVETAIRRRMKAAFYKALHLLLKFPRSSNIANWRALTKSYIEVGKEANLLYLQREAAQAREIPSKWLSAQLKKKLKKTKVKEILHPISDCLVSSDTGILDGFRAFYQDLYTERKSDLNLLETILEEKWGTENTPLDQFDEPFELEELNKAIEQAAWKKSPGIDGLSNLVYKYLNEEYRNCLLAAFNEAHKTGQLGANWKKGIITLIFKKGDPSSTGNYRPITLLNSDYKLLCKMLANRLNQVLTKIIPRHQIGFMK